jgi:glutaminase
VKEAYVTLLDLSVVLQMISYLYLYAALAKVAFSKTAGDGFYGKARLRFAAIGGLAATIVGGAVAFVPPRQVVSVWTFELKMFGNCIGFMGIAAMLFWYYSRRRAA